MFEPNSKVSESSKFAAKVSDYYQEKEEYNKTFTQVYSQLGEQSEKGSASNIGVNMPIQEKDNKTAGDDKSKAPESTQSSIQSQTNSAAQKATIMDHKAMPGPVSVTDLPEAKSRDDLHQKAQDLNK